MPNTSSAAQRAAAIESWNCAVLLRRIIAGPYHRGNCLRAGRAFSAENNAAQGGSAPLDANQHFLAAVQRDLLTSVESRGS